MSKHTLHSSTLLFSLFLLATSHSQADTPSTGGSSDQLQLNALYAIKHSIVAHAKADALAHNNELYQPDKNIDSAISINQATRQLNKENTSNDDTNKMIREQYSQTASALLDDSSPDLKDLQDITQQLTRQINIGDVPSLPRSTKTFNYNYLGTDQPVTLGSNAALTLGAVNFGMLNSMHATDKKQQELTTAYRYLLTGINSTNPQLNWRKFNIALNGLSKQKDKDAFIIKVLSNKDYQAYELHNRTSIAQITPALYVINQYFANKKQTNVKGIKDNKGNTINNPSSEQIENYRANYRLNDGTWASSLKSLSTANLLKEIAIELAENNHFTYELHQDIQMNNLLTAVNTIQQNQLNKQAALLAVNKAQKVIDESPN